MTYEMQKEGAESEQTYLGQNLAEKELLNNSQLEARIKFLEGFVLGRLESVNDRLDRIEKGLFGEEEDKVGKKN